MQEKGNVYLPVDASREYLRCLIGWIFLSKNESWKQTISNEFELRAKLKVLFYLLRASLYSISHITVFSLYLGPIVSWDCSHDSLNIEILFPLNQERVWYREIGLDSIVIGVDSCYAQTYRNRACPSDGLRVCEPILRLCLAIEWKNGVER